MKVTRMAKSRVPLPTIGTPGSAGIDFYLPTSITIEGKSRETIPLGIKVIIPKGRVLLLHDKSGIAKKLGLVCIGGVIDSDYRGEIHVTFYNSNRKEVTLLANSKVVQGIVVSYFNDLDVIDYEEFEDIVNAEAFNQRGDKGFGAGTGSPY